MIDDDRRRSPPYWKVSAIREDTPKVIRPGRHLLSSQKAIQLMNTEAYVGINSCSM